MTLVAGASQYLNAATLANVRGVAPSTPSLLSQATDAASILDSGRSALGNSGIGISASARALNQSFLSRSTDVNALFSLGAGSDATVEGAQQQILAIRARTQTERLAPSLIKVPEELRGSNVDTTA